MNYLYKYYKFNESEEKENNSKDNPKRSERLLTQAQKESDFNVRIMERKCNKPNT
jgi:hypothetical protein